MVDEKAKPIAYNN